MTHKLSILLVEDEKNICDFISTSLSAQDYRISTAHTGKEALPIITSQCPDLILLDLGLPDMDGMEIIRQVRTWSSVPIIVLSARTQEQEKVRALDLGADDYLTKPIGTFFRSSSGRLPDGTATTAIPSTSSIWRTVPAIFVPSENLTLIESAARTASA